MPSARRAPHSSDSPTAGARWLTLAQARRGVETPDDSRALYQKLDALRADADADDPAREEARRAAPLTPRAAGRRPACHRRAEPIDSTPLHDRVAVESPLQVRLDEEPFAVIMRTPGDDEALVLGFLHAEGVIATRADAPIVNASHTRRKR